MAARGRANTAVARSGARQGERDQFSGRRRSCRRQSPVGTLTRVWEARGDAKVTRHPALPVWPPRCAGAERRVARRTGDHSRGEAARQRQGASSNADIGPPNAAVGCRCRASRRTCRSRSPGRCRSCCCRFPPPSTRRRENDRWCPARVPGRRPARPCRTASRPSRARRRNGVESETCRIRIPCAHEGCAADSCGSAHDRN